MEPGLNLMDLPAELLAKVATFLAPKALKNFGLVNQKCQQIFQIIDGQDVDLRKRSKVCEKKILEILKTRNYIRLNLNECYWLSSWATLKLISKASVKELKLVGCDCGPDVIAAVCEMNLTSLSFSLTEDWMQFIVLNKRNSIYCFKRLKKMKVFHPNRDFSGQLVNYVSRYVLRHCPNLLYLKISTCAFSQIFTVRNFSYDSQSFSAPNVPTPVPKLDSLILNLNTGTTILENINNLLKVILNKKESPLKRFSLGQQTANALMNGFICGENISFEKTTICCFSYQTIFGRCFILLSDVLKADGVEGMVTSMLKSSTCKKISIESLEIDNVIELTKKIIKSGNTSINAISLRRSTISLDICYLINAISNQSSGITFLDLSESSWKSGNQNNSVLMDCLVHLTNLLTLYLTPSMFTGDRNALKLSFYKVANSCHLIKNFRITSFYRDSVVYEDILSNIKYFNNLQELHLANFYIFGNQGALAQITESCLRLKYLYIYDIFFNWNDHNELKIEDCLFHAQQLKHLSLVYVRLKFTKQLVNALTKCIKLEKLFIVSYYENKFEENKYFADNLKKLTELQVLIMVGDGRFWSWSWQLFKLAMNYFKGRPFFCAMKRGDEPNLPLAHHHLMQYMTNI